MSFEKFTGSGRQSGGEPLISLRKSGGIGINSAAMSEWFADASYVVCYYNEDDNEIGLKPLDEDEGEDAEGAYTLTRNQGNGSVAPQSFLKTYDLIPEITTRYHATYNEDEELVVVDLDEPAGTYGTAADEEDGEEDSEE